MNVRKILDTFGVKYEEVHKSLSKKCVGLDCPYCPDTDKHLGIFLDNGRTFCWKCKRSGTLFGLLHRLKGITKEQYRIATGGVVGKQGETPKETLDTIFIPQAYTAKEIPVDNSIIEKTFLPFFSSKAFSKPIDNDVFSVYGNILQYIISRGWSLEDLISHGVGYSLTGPMTGRIIIPYHNPYHRDIILGYIGRDFTGINNTRYLVTKGLHTNRNVYENKTAVNWSDPSTMRVLVVVEGIFDSWATKYPSVALCGKAISPYQINQIMTLYPTKTMSLIVCLDGDTSIREAHHIRDSLGVIFNNSAVICLHKNADPASLPKGEFDTIVYKTLTLLNTSL